MNVKARKVSTQELSPFKQPLGEYALSGKGIMVRLPCGDFFNDFEGKWEYTNIEDEDKITMKPSILCSPEKPCWHGYLTNGEFHE